MDYWYRSPKHFLESMGIDPAKMKPEDEYVKVLTQTILESEKSDGSKLALLAVVLDGKVVGTHSVSELTEGASAVFHAHFWHPEARGIGLGTYTYPRAAKIFIDRFHLTQIIFKTPAQNVAANRIKQKLGLPVCGEEPVTYDFMLPNVMAKVYRLSHQQLAVLLAQ